MNHTEFKSGKVYRFADFSIPVKGAVAVQRILSKTTGELAAIAIDTDQLLETKFSPFDTYIHVIEGKVETVINGGSLSISAGEFLIIPGHSRNTSKALEPSRVLSLVMKSGYEQFL